MSLNKWVTDTDQIRVHNIFFYEKKKIIPKSSELPPLICITSDYMTDAAQSEVPDAAFFHYFASYKKTFWRKGPSSG